jgi:VIT1/CCC1 family predicted Fe2+/Mn2+ transporter
MEVIRCSFEDVGWKLEIRELALFTVGVYRAKTTVGKPARSDLQMAIIGTVSALAGYAIGALFSA